MIVQAKIRCKDVVVVGVDQSLRGTAICISREGVLEPLFLPEKKKRGAGRLLSIRNQIFQEVDKHIVSLAVLEGYAYDAAGRVFELGELGGVIKAEFYLREIPCISVPPTSLKKFATGNGSASKDRMIKAVAEKYGFETKNDNIADAVALAKLGEVYLTEESTYRSELEVVKMLKEEKAKHGNQYRKLTQLSF